MTSLPEHIAEITRAGVCVLGLGNPDYGDDAFGVRLAEKLSQAGVENVIIGGANPEHCIGAVADEGFDNVLFLDAVEMGAAPGSAVLISMDEIAARYGQVSTHKLSLATLAQIVEAGGRTEVYLLGVQPRTMKMGAAMSEEVRSALESLYCLIVESRLGRHIRTREELNA